MTREEAIEFVIEEITYIKDGTIRCMSPYDLLRRKRMAEEAIVHIKSLEAQLSSNPLQLKTCEGCVSEMFYGLYDCTDCNRSEWVIDKYKQRETT